MLLLPHTGQTPTNKLLMVGDVMIIETYKLNETIINIHNDYLPKNEREQATREKQLTRIILNIVKEIAKRETR